MIKGMPRMDPIMKELNSLVDGSKIDGEQKVEVSECLALVMRAKGKAVQSATSQAVYKTISEIISESKGGFNDKVVANCAVTLGYLSAYSNDANQMKVLFNAFDDGGNDAVMLPLKFAILTNGNDSLDKSELLAEFESLLVERLVDSAGFEEIDDDPAPLAGGEDEEVFRFKGVIDLMAYVLDKYGRRDWC